MSLTAREIFELHVLKRVNSHPQWVRSFQIGLVNIRLMVDSGVIERHAPEGSRVKNQIKITDKGVDRLAELRAKEAK